MMCMVAHVRDFFWKTWGRMSLLVWCQGAKACRSRQAEASHNPAPTSTPTSRPSTPRFRPSVTIPSFHPGPSVPPVLLQNATKSATSLNHPNRLNSPEYTTYLMACQIHVHMSIKVQESPCLVQGMPCQPLQIPSSKSNTDRPDRIGLTSSFIRGITFPANFPSTHHRPLHCGTTNRIHWGDLAGRRQPTSPTRRGMTSVSRHARWQFSSAS